MEAWVSLKSEKGKGLCAGTVKGKSKATVIQAKQNDQFCQLLQDQSMTQAHSLKVQRDLKGLIASPEERLELAQDHPENIRG